MRSEVYLKQKRPSFVIPPMCGTRQAPNKSACIRNAQTAGGTRALQNAAGVFNEGLSLFLRTLSQQHPVPAGRICPQRRPDTEDN